MCQKERELEVEMVLKTEEVEGYRNKLSVQSMSGVMGIIEEELRERLKIQEREMAEQLDRIEVKEKRGEGRGKGRGEGRERILRNGCMIE